MTGWSADDIRVASLLEAEFPNVHVVDVIHHERQNMTETAPEITWDDEEQSAPTSGGATYPEQPDNPHEAPLSVNFKPGGTPQLTVRGRTVAEHMQLLNEVKSSGLLALIASVSGDFGGQGPTLAPQAPAQGGWQTPQTPPPFGQNVSVPAAPGYVGPPVQQQAPQWGGQQQGGRMEPKPRPNWPQVWKINVPRDAKETFKQFRQQNSGVLKGKVAWAGGGDYWVHGDVVSGFGQYNPVAA